MNNDIEHEPKHRGHIRRYRQIVMILGKYRLENVLRYVGLQNYRLVGWMFRGNPWRKMTYSEPERMRMAIEELGTFFIKLGQILSTRTDLLPPVYTIELSKLQNSLRPTPVEKMQQVITDELNRPLNEVFLSLDEPIGIASIGQVYSCGEVLACTLADGTEVVTKVQKPGVPEQIEEDMEILNRAALFASKHWKAAQQYDLVGIAREISDTIISETDYIQEGHNAEYFAQFFKDDPMVHVPKIYWESTTSKVLTMERMRGICIRDVEALDKAGFDRKDLAKRAVGLWLKMVFEGDAFHADPHPGNLFVEADGRLGLIDFGMVYAVDDEIRWRLASVVKAVLDRDVDKLIDALIEVGAVRLQSEEARANLRKDLKSMMNRISTARFQKHSESVSANLEQLLSVLRSNQVQLPSSTFMLLKTIIMAQGLGRALDTDFNILPMLESSVRGLIKKRYSIKAALRKLPSVAVELVTLAGGLPQRMDRMMKKAERGEIQLRVDASGVERHIHHLERLVYGMMITMIAAGIIGLVFLFVALRLGR